jgi:hypothetical protein
MTFTHAELMRCAEREMRLRMRVYPHWVRQGRYTADQAHREIAMMEEIMRHFAVLVEPTPDLFDLDEPAP